MQEVAPRGRARWCLCSDAQINPISTSIPSAGTLSLVACEMSSKPCATATFPFADHLSTAGLALGVPGQTRLAIHASMYEHPFNSPKTKREVLAHRNKDRVGEKARQ